LLLLVGRHFSCEVEEEINKIGGWRVFRYIRLPLLYSIAHRLIHFCHELVVVGIKRRTNILDEPLRHFVDERDGVVEMDHRPVKVSQK
ncbi:hypothetical protein PFISCL1PPCAC_8418, partial [Pristionchus fissidentatus]